MYKRGYKQMPPGTPFQPGDILETSGEGISRGVHFRPSKERRKTVRAKRPVQHTQPAIAELFDRYLEDCDVSQNEQQAIQYFVDYVQQQQASAQ